MFPGESEQSPEYLPGDVIFRLRTAPHHVFQRVGANLFADLQLTMLEALLGFSKNIVHLDGRVVTVSSQDVVQPFQVKVIHGEGMPKHESYEKGDLHVKLIVKLPQEVSSAQRVLLAQVFS